MLELELELELELAECIGCLVSVVMERGIRNISKDGSASIWNIIAASTILLITLERHTTSNCRLTNMVINNCETTV